MTYTTARQLLTAIAALILGLATAVGVSLTFVNNTQHAWDQATAHWHPVNMRVIRCDAYLTHCLAQYQLHGATHEVTLPATATSSGVFTAFATSSGQIYHGSTPYPDKSGDMTGYVILSGLMGILMAVLGGVLVDWSFRQVNDQRQRLHYRLHGDSHVNLIWDPAHTSTLELMCFRPNMSCNGLVMRGVWPLAFVPPFILIGVPTWIAFVTAGVCISNWSLRMRGVKADHFVNIYREWQLDRAVYGDDAYIAADAYDRTADELAQCNVGYVRVSREAINDKLWRIHRALLRLGATRGYATGEVQEARAALAAQVVAQINEMRDAAGAAKLALERHREAVTPDLGVLADEIAAETAQLTRDEGRLQGSPGFTHAARQAMEIGAAFEHMTRELGQG